MKLLKKLDKKRLDAEQQLEKAMSEKWPEGCVVQFMLAYNQKVPSSGRVMSCNAPYLRVSLNTTKMRSARDVHYSAVLE